MVMAEWAERETAVPSPFLLERLHFCLTEYVYYDEIGVAYTRLLHETKDFIATLKVSFYLFIYLFIYYFNIRQLALNSLRHFSIL